MAGLRLVGLAKRFADGTEALAPLDLEVPDGGFCVLLGPSGCGKTTLLRLVAGLETPTAGEVWIGARRVDGLAPQARNVAMVFQDYALYPHMRVRDNLAFPLRMRGVPRAERERRVREVARLLGIEPLLGRLPRELSGGQRQRVAMGRALVREPAVFLMDEPLSNLDARLRVEMRAEIAALHRRTGGTFLYVTHDQVEAMTLGERIAVLDRGRLQQLADPDTLYARPANAFVAGFVGSPGMNLVPARVRAGAAGPEAEAAGAPVRLPEARRAVLAAHAGAALTLGVRPEALRAGPPPAEAAWRLRGRCEAVERLGHEQVVWVRADGGARIAARLPARERIDAGEALALWAPASALYWFGADGRLLAAPADAAGAPR